jgi:hypothetical protein
VGRQRGRLDRGDDQVNGCGIKVDDGLVTPKHLPLDLDPQSLTHRRRLIHLHPQMTQRDRAREAWRRIKADQSDAPGIDV